MSNRGGGAGGAGDGRPVDAGDDVQGVGSGAELLHRPDIPEHVLHVQDSASDHLRHPHADLRPPSRPDHGRHSAGETLRRLRPELHAQPRSLQHQGTRHHHHLRQLRRLVRRRRRLLHRSHHCHEGLLQAEHQLPLCSSHRLDHSGFGICFLHHYNALSLDLCMAVLFLGFDLFVCLINADFGIWMGWDATEISG